MEGWVVVVVTAEMVVMVVAVVQVASLLAGVVAFAVPRRRGVSRVLVAVVVWFATPLVVLTGGVLVMIPAAVYLLWQINSSYDRGRYPVYR